MKNELSYSIEDELRANGYRIICGVDEAGRGPLCGPVCAGACILREGEIIEGLNDSKKLSASRREALFDEITEKIAEENRFEEESRKVELSKSFSEENVRDFDFSEASEQKSVSNSEEPFYQLLLL